MFTNQKMVTLAISVSKALNICSIGLPQHREKEEFGCSFSDGEELEIDLIIKNIFLCEEFTLYAGFPPIREISENFEDFFQSGKSGKNRGFSAKIRGKISNQGTFSPNHFQTF